MPAPFDHVGQVRRVASSGRPRRRPAGAAAGSGVRSRALPLDLPHSSHATLDPASVAPSDLGRGPRGRRPPRRGAPPGPAPSPPAARGAVPGARHPPRPGGATLPPRRWRLSRRQRRAGRLLAPRLPRARVLGPVQPHPPARRGRRSHPALARTPGAEDPHRAGGERDAASPGDLLGRALPCPGAGDAAGGPDRAGLCAAKRAQARHVPPRIRSVLVGGMVHGVEMLAASAHLSGTGRAAADVARVGRVAPTWAHRNRGRTGPRRAGSSARSAAMVRRSTRGLLPASPPQDVRHTRDAGSRRARSASSTRFTGTGTPARAAARTTAPLRASCSRRRPRR